MRSRSGKLGVFASIVLMFSIVLFVGCMFWLLSEASMINGSPTGSLFKPATTQIDGPRTMNQTIAELKRSGVIVARYTKDYQGGYANATYVTFITEAGNMRLVYRVEDLRGTEVLLIEATPLFIQWYPD